MDNSKMKEVKSDGKAESRKDDSAAENSGNPNGPERRAKRKRPRTRGLRLQIATEIEKALSMQHSPIQHLLSVNAAGVESASLKEVVACLGLNSKQYQALSPVALFKMGKISGSFRIRGTNHEDATLFVLKNFIDVDAATIYVDKLPRRCTVKLLERRMRMFGTVVSIRPIYRFRVRNRGQSSKSAQSSDQQPSASNAAVSVPRCSVVQCAFVQFTSAFAAQRCCSNYWWNLPDRFITKFKIQMMKEHGAKPFPVDEYAPDTVFDYIANARKRAYKRALRRARKLARESAAGQPSSGKPLPPVESTGSGVSTGPNVDVGSVGTVGSCVQAENLVNSTSTSDSAKEPKADDGAKAVKKRRIRQHRRMHRTRRPKHLIVHVASYFRGMQAIPLARFKELRKKYFWKKQCRMRTLKKELRKGKIPVNVPGEGSGSRKRKLLESNISLNVPREGSGSRKKELHESNIPLNELGEGSAVRKKEFHESNIPLNELGEGSAVRKRELHESNIPLNVPREGSAPRKKRRGRSKLIARAVNARDRCAEDLV